MRNEFQAVGMLINDLRKERTLVTDGIIDMMRHNFNEITLQLGYAWYQKVEWLDYLLDFHLNEAERLQAFVVPVDGAAYPAIRAVLFEELGALAGRLDMLINGGDEVDLSTLF
ncbi:MAG: hypothetical protein V4594_21060 [Bacteroidota bacterium]